MVTYLERKKKHKKIIKQYRNRFSNKLSFELNFSIIILQRCQIIL